MGVASRATHAIDPQAADLLMPDRGIRLDAARGRDVEDACFEPVTAPRDMFPSRPGNSAGNGVFKSRITQPEAVGPVPRDFAGRTTAPGKRLGVFAGSNGGIASRGLFSPLATLALAVCASAAAFWMAGGHALVLSSGNQEPASRVSAPANPLAKPAVLPPDPVKTSSVPVAKARAAESGFSAPVPRPARIERAGSILMIRPAAD